MTVQAIQGWQSHLDRGGHGARTRDRAGVEGGEVTWGWLECPQPLCGDEASANQAVAAALGQKVGQTWHDLVAKVAALRERAEKAEALAALHAEQLIAADQRAEEAIRERDAARQCHADALHELEERSDQLDDAVTKLHESEAAGAVWRAIGQSAGARPAFVRDPDFECAEYVVGPPASTAACATDGHYLCGDCAWNMHRLEDTEKKL